MNREAVSGMILILLFVGMLTLASNIQPFEPSDVLEIDFAIVDFGEVVQCVRKTVLGDENMSTPNKPTLRNLISYPLQISVHFTTMVGDTLGKTIELFDAVFKGERLEFNASETITFTNPLDPYETQQIDFSIHARMGTPADTYRGNLTIEIPYTTTLEVPAVAVISGAIPHPDLSISSPDIAFSVLNPSEGQTVTISAKVHNLGEENTENTTVQFFDGNVSFSEQQISLISHHSHGTASIDWTAEDEGFHLIKVVVDPYNNINETDEENNEATRSILVGEIPCFGGIVLNGSATPNETRTGCPVTVQGYAEYNTTYGAGEPVAGAEVTITITGWQQETTHTIKDGTYKADITSPYAPGNYTIVVTVTDFTFWESIEIGLNVTQEEGVDLTLSSHDISFSPSDPIENQNVSITATIHNVGTENATDILVAFYDDGKPIENGIIDLIPGGGSEDTTIPWNATPYGWHNITVVVDPLDTIQNETDENNNKASKNIYVYPPLPDLTPTNIDFSDNTPLVNQTITISADVQNIGGGNASDVLVSFYDGNQSIGNTTIPWIPGKRASRTASINHSFTLNGSHLICVIVDPNNDIKEPDEENNKTCTSIHVHLPSPDLAISSSDITFSNSTPTIGDIITIYATIHNIGEVDAQNVTVEFFDDGTRINYTTIPAINASEQETVYTSWNATPAGWHRIRVVVDGNDTVKNEIDENNNIATRYIHVSPEEASDLYMDQTLLYSEDIVFSNTNPAPGENVTIYATVHNIGEAEAQNVTVRFYVDDIQLGMPQTIPSISVGESETASKKWIASEVGSHVVKVIVDAPNEKNKDNNVATRAIIVGKRDVAIVNITFSKQDPAINEAVCIYVTVENRGDIAETFDTSLNYTRIIDPLIGTQTITLAPAESMTLNFTWTPTTPGRYEIKAYTSTIPNDINPTDNTKTTYLYVTSGLPDGGLGGRSVACLY